MAARLAGAAVMAPIADVAGPQRRQAILPPPYRWIGRASVLDEDEPAARPENAPHLGERRARIGNAAQRPRHQHGIDAPIVNRQRFRGRRQVADRKRAGAETGCR
jgi:hypothetical protein